MSAATGPAGGAAAPAGNGGGTAPLAVRLPTMQGIVQDSCGVADVWRAGYGAQGRITMSSRVVRFAGAAARPGTARRGLKDRTAAEGALEPEPPGARRVGWGFISLYTL